MDEDPRGSELPILDELGEELHRVARRADARERSRGAGRVGAGSRPGWRWPRLRPAFVSLAVLILVGLPVGAALRGAGGGEQDAAQGGRASQPAASEVAVTVASGTGPDEAWQLHGGEGACLVLEAGGEPVARTGCDDAGDRGSATPGAEGRAALELGTVDRAVTDFAVANGSRDGYVFGRASDSARSVRITVERRATVTVPARAAAGRSGVDLDGRLFVAAFDRPIPRRARVIVAVLDARGRAIARVGFAGTR